MPVASAGGDQQPRWNAGTSVWRAVKGTLAKLESELVGVTPVEGAPPLPKRGGPWPTQQGDRVDIGDLVALRLHGPVGGLDAKGRIIRGVSVGVVECVLGDSAKLDDSRPRLQVDVANLVMLLERAGGGDPIDRKRL